MDVDPVGLVRGKGENEGWLDRYVNDRPYAASSLMSVAIAQVLRSALIGQSRERPELAATAIPLEATIENVPCREGEAFLKRLFEPLGYEVEATRAELAGRFPDWGTSNYYRLRLRRTCTLKELLTQVYVLLPVLDDEKHYWVGEAEVEKLLRHGSGWLEAHPQRQLIVARYLRRQGRLVRDALSRLAPDAASAEEEEANDSEEAAVEAAVVAETPALGLHEQRIQRVLEVLRASSTRRVLDLGCGEGRLLRELLRDKQFEHVVGLDASHRALEVAATRLRLEHLPTGQRERLTLLHGALTYRDSRLEGFDAAAIVEVVEHLDPPRLRAFERVVWQFARPRVIVLTTPNREYNVKWPSLPAGRLRHRDHRFEWTRAEFEAWSGAVAQRFGYEVECLPLGPVDEALGAPSQMAIFRLASEARTLAS
jgi:3' terminal RNA ribose 2'-O-methyltransferase Hen1